MTTAELLLTDGPGEVRAALVEDATVVAVRHWRNAGAVQPGAVFRARVVAVQAGKGICRLDLGQGLDAIMPDRQGRQGFSEGQMVTVQIAALPGTQDPDKKPVARRRLALEGRSVTVETGRRVTVSPRFDADEASAAALMSALDEVGGRVRVTVEPAAALADPAAVADEARALGGLLLTLAADDSAPGLLLEAPGPIHAALTAMAPAGGALVHVDGRRLTGQVRAALDQMPAAGLSVQPWRDRDPLFSAFGVEDAIEAALAPEVDLPGGGSLGIDQTRGGAVIDVNQRGRDGASLETNRLSLNQAAARWAAHQIRLQDLAGQIFIDFVDLKRAQDWDKVLATLDAALARDPRPSRRHQVKAAGLVVVNRQRRGPSLRDQLLAPCVARLSVESEALALAAQSVREAGSDPQPGPLVIHAPAPVAEYLRTAPGLLDDVTERTGRPVTVETGNPVRIDVGGNR